MNPSLQLRIDEALDAIARVRAHYRRPALMCSFGKDSMVLLHLVRQRARWMLPVIYHRDPWWPAKNRFADRMIARLDLEVHDWPPAAVAMREGAEAYTSFYQIGALPEGVLGLPKNILPPVPGERLVCGLHDVLGRPKAHFAYPWDAVLIGHKSTDIDAQEGPLPLHCDIKQNPDRGPAAAFPLRNWSDDDVWDYTELEGIVQQPDRYDPATRTELADKTASSDYAHVCIACIDRRRTERSVYCPKFNCEVDVIADQVPYQKPAQRYYGALTETLDPRP